MSKELKEVKESAHEHNWENIQGEGTDGLFSLRQENVCYVRTITRMVSVDRVNWSLTWTYECLPIPNPNSRWEDWVQVAYNEMKKKPINTEHLAFDHLLMFSYFIFTLIYWGWYYNHHFTNWSNNTWIGYKTRTTQLLSNGAKTWSLQILNSFSYTIQPH